MGSDAHEEDQGGPPTRVSRSPGPASPRLCHELTRRYVAPSPTRLISTNHCCASVMSPRLERPNGQRQRSQALPQTSPRPASRHGLPIAGWALSRTLLARLSKVLRELP